MKKMIKRCLPAIMALALCLSLLPMNGFAADNGKCPSCGGETYTKGDFIGCNDCPWNSTNPQTTQPEPNDPPEEKPTGHEHTWTYEANFWEAFTHVKVCSGCGEKVTESCPAEVIFQNGGYVRKCTLCNYWWEPAEAPICGHKGTYAWDTGEGTHVVICTSCKEQVGEAEAHKFTNGKCECGAQEPANVPTVPDDVPGEGTNCGTCPICGGDLVLKGSRVVCPDGHIDLPYHSSDDEIWCSQCSDYAQPVACGAWVCYEGKYIRHVVKAGTNCVDVNIHDHECDECHAPMVTRGWVTVEKPTCVKPGSEELWCTYEWCKVDQKPADTREIPVLNLESLWGEWKDNGDGTSTRVCTFCNGKEDGHLQTKDSVYTLTICYEFPGGEKVFDDYVDTLKAGASYSVKSPVKSGYQAEQTVVEGKMPAADEKVTVKYTLINYTLVVNYVDAANGAVLDTADLGIVNLGGSYAIEERSFSGYYQVADQALSGTVDESLIGGADANNQIVLNVYYTALGTHVVRWVNWDGTELETGSFPEGQQAPAAGAYSGAAPTRPSDGTYTYSFRGWSAPAISEDGTVTYTAEFTPTRIILPPEPTELPELPEEVEIEDPDTPLVELPEEVEIEEPDTPLAELPEELVEIEEPDTPLAELPEEIEIEDPGVPLADVPQTGDNPFIWEALALISGAALVWLVLDGKKRRTAE